MCMVLTVFWPCLGLLTTRGDLVPVLVHPFMEEHCLMVVCRTTHVRRECPGVVVSARPGPTASCQGRLLLSQRPKWPEVQSEFLSKLEEYARTLEERAPCRFGACGLLMGGQLCGCLGSKVRDTGPATP